MMEIGLWLFGDKNERAWETRQADENVLCLNGQLSKWTEFGDAGYFQVYKLHIQKLRFQVIPPKT